MIPYYDMTYIHKPIKEKFMSEVKELLDKSDFVFGTEKFEEKFAEYTGAKYCIGLNSGTSALTLALLTSGVRPGNKVVTVSHTFTATVSAIKYLGGQHQFIDIDEKTYCMNPNLLQSVVGFDTKVILPVHMYGNACDMKNILDKKSIATVIEDCSQAHGTKINGQHVGTFGKAGCFSFYPGKGLGAFGDAGCIITDDEGFAEEIKEQRSWKEDDVGFNYRMSNLNAKFLNLKLKYLDEVITIKKDIAKYYDKHLSYCHKNEGVEHSYHIYPLLHNNREGLINRCKETLELKTHYNKPVHFNPAFKTTSKTCSICSSNEEIEFDLPITEKISSSQVSVPIYPGLNKEEVIDILQKNWSGNGVSNSIL